MRTDQAVKSGGQRLGLSSTTLGCHSIRVVYITDNCSITTVYIPSYGGFYYIPITNPNFTPNHFRLFASSWDVPLLTRVLQGDDRPPVTHRLEMVRVYTAVTCLRPESKVNLRPASAYMFILFHTISIIYNIYIYIYIK